MKRHFKKVPGGPVPAYDYVMAQAEKKKEKLKEAAGLDTPNTGLGAG